MAQKQKEALLSEEQVDKVLSFSQALWAVENGYGYFSPWLSNQNLTNLNNNPLAPDMDKLKKALADYKNSAPQINSFMEFMQKFDMMFARTLESYINMLAFDLQVVCRNAFTQADYESPTFAEDKRRVYSFLDNFDYVAEFRRVVSQVMRKETFFTWFRKTGRRGENMKYTLQIMPQEFCMLTGYWEKGLLYDFDMGYFLQPGVDIEGFDPAFKEYYRNTFGENLTIDNYRPTNPLNNRDGTYAFWTQTSPDLGAWCFKRSLDNFNNTPYLAPLMKDMLRNIDIGELQYNKDFASAYAILAGEIGVFDSAKSGTKADQMVFSPKTLGGFMAKVKQGLPKEYTAVAMPVENIKSFQFTDSNKDMYSEQLANTAGIGSSTSRIIYSTDRMSNAEVEAAIINDYETMKPLYNQFNNFLEFYVNKITKKYKFKFIFDGCSYPFSHQKKFDNLMKLADKGLVLNSSAYASAFGMPPQLFDYSLTEGRYGDMQEKLSLLLNANTTKDGSAGGRPTIDGSVSDSTEASRDNEEGLE